jgi:hypothetical protein
LLPKICRFSGGSYYVDDKGVDAHVTLSKLESYFDREALTSYMAKDGYTAELVIALGAPSETVKLVDAKGDDIKYYRDENSVHYVPKRPLDELILK